MTPNTKLAVLRTRAPERKGSTGFDTNHYGIKKKQIDRGIEIHLLLWEMKHVKVNTFIHSFRKWVHIDSGSAQFKHPDRSLSQHTETPHCVIWWNFDGGYVVLAFIRYVCDFQNTNEAVIGCVLPSTTHKFRPQRGSSYWPVSQCPLMAETLPDNSQSMIACGMMTGNICE